MEERHFDIHGVAAVASRGVTAVFAATPVGLFRSTDDGTHWSATRYEPNLPFVDGLERALFYTRSVLATAQQPEVVLAGVGRKPPNHGTQGGVRISHDSGTTWAPASPPTRSTVWLMAGHRELPDSLAGVTICGQVVVSTNGGLWWEPLEREFGELKAVAVTPVVP
jgi:hypothetical protein